MAMATRVVPEEVSRVLLDDTLVQQVIQDRCDSSGRDAADALKDAAVQRVLLQTCRERHAEWADALDHGLGRWVADRQVQNLARMATALRPQPETVVMARIQQGSPSVTLAAQCVCSIVVLHCGISLCVPSTLLGDPVSYVLTIHLMLFALLSALFEVRANWVQSVGVLDVLQNYLLEKAKFMADNLGRGLFYVFQASLWLSLMSSSDSMWLICFVCTLGVGIALVAGRYNPTFTEKVTTTYRPLAKDVLP